MVSVTMPVVVLEAAIVPGRLVRTAVAMANGQCAVRCAESHYMDGRLRTKMISMRVNHQEYMLERAMKLTEGIEKT